MRKDSIVGILAVLIGVGAAATISMGKMRVKTHCRDVRTYMEGGIYANIMQGGLTPKTRLEIFELKNNQREFLGNQDVMMIQNPPGNDVFEVYSSPEITLKLFKMNEKGHWPAFIKGFSGGKEISGQLICKPKK